MPRIVLFVLVLFVLWRLLVAFGRRNASAGLGADSFSRFSPQQRRRRKEAAPGSHGEPLEELVRCVECGTYVPAGQTLLSGVDGEARCSSCRHHQGYDGHHEA